MLCGPSALPQNTTQAPCLSLLVTGTICPWGPPRAGSRGPLGVRAAGPLSLPPGHGDPLLGCAVPTSVGRSQPGARTDPHPWFCSPEPAEPGRGGFSWHRSWAPLTVSPPPLL